MKKIVSIILTISLTLSLFLNGILVIAAEEYTGTILAVDGLRVRTGPGTQNTQIALLPFGATVDMVDNIKVDDTQGCGDDWYRVYYSGTNIGYVCSTFLEVEKKIEENVDGIPDTEFEKSLQEKGFPSTYWASLSALHEKYPTWEFEAIITKLDWDKSVEAQSAGTKSLIQTSNDGYKSTEGGSYNFLTDTFTVREGSNWYSADSDVVAYYLDPRNFLNEKQIFMFEKLNYDPSYQTADAIKAVFGSSSYLNNYVNDFIAAGLEEDINPIYLASRVRQEVGTSVGTATSGASFTYDGKTYSGLYNLFNIGATTSSNPVLKGLIWANGGTDSSATSFQRPWTSITKSIHGGAEFLALSYISQGQYTSYLQKFNVAPDATSSSHSHQYMTNIQAVASESYSSFNSYEDMNLLNSPFVFSIPVFVDMPDETSLPDPGNPNNHLSTLKINDLPLIGFSHDIYEYTFPVHEDALFAKINATAIHEAATITGTGDIVLDGDTTTVKVKVTAENGDIQEYTINLVKTEGATMTVPELLTQAGLKSDGQYLTSILAGTSTKTISEDIQKVSSGATVTIKDKSGTVKTDTTVVTGDTVTVINGESTSTYTVVSPGDNNGDGAITILDLLLTQKHILKYSTLETAYLKASDVNYDNEVTILDLLLIQKHILGYTYIE